eukprot:COSAG04_NODE_28550_length_275_cov_0.579545_1_plen_68_part_10
MLPRGAGGAGVAGVRKNEATSCVKQYFSFVRQHFSSVVQICDSAHSALDLSSTSVRVFLAKNRGSRPI